MKSTLWVGAFLAATMLTGSGAFAEEIIVSPPPAVIQPAPVPVFPAPPVIVSPIPGTASFLPGDQFVAPGMAAVSTEGGTVMYSDWRHGRLRPGPGRRRGPLLDRRRWNDLLSVHDPNGHRKGRHHL